VADIIGARRAGTVAMISSGVEPLEVDRGRTARRPHARRSRCADAVACRTHV